MTKLPIIILIDDSAPVVNSLYYQHHQLEGKEIPVQQSGEPMVARAPLALMEEFADTINEFQVRGKFSISPYPAGLGSIIDGWDGADKNEIDTWLKIARERVEPLMDITPEMLTHTLALDVNTKKCLRESEKVWSHKQNEKSLTAYLTYALELLKQSGFDANGITSPWNFAKEVEADYARAILQSQRKVYNRNFTWYFLDADPEPAGKQSYVYLRDEAGGTVVSIVSKGQDFLWQTMETKETSPEYISSIADVFIDKTADKGMLVDIFNAKVPIVFHTHWQSLFSNNRHTGLKALKEICQRIERNWASKTEWTKCSTFAESIAE